MSLNATATITPVTPDKQLRAAYLVSSSPRSASQDRARSRSPSNAHLSTLDPRHTTPMTDGRTTPGTESVNGDGEWSSAVGRASVAGKSGRVIERLMGDVDRLKRELNLAQARVEEEQLRGASAREALDSLRGTKENLEAINETNQNIITRRDRKIEDLKAELELERSKRIEAEGGRNDLSVRFHNLKTDTEKEVYRATEIANRSQTEYEACRKSLKAMKAEWDRSLGQMRKELEVVHSDRSLERTHWRQMEKISGEIALKELQHESLAQRALDGFNDYKKLRDDSVKEMGESIRGGDAANEQLHAEMQKTLGQMRWVMNVRRDVLSIRQRDEDDAGGPGEKAG